MSLSGPILSLHLPFDSAAWKEIPEIRKPKLRTHKCYSLGLKKKKNGSEHSETCRNLSFPDLGGLDPSRRGAKKRKLTTTNNNSSKNPTSQRLLNADG